MTTRKAINPADQKKKIEKDINKAVEALLELTKVKVAFHLAVHVDGKTK